MTAKIQVSLKEDSGIIWVLGGDTADEFEQTLKLTLGPDLGGAMLQRLHDVFAAASVGLASSAVVAPAAAAQAAAPVRPSAAKYGMYPQGQQPPADVAPWDNPHPAPAWSQGPAPVAAPAPAAAGGGETVQDNFGNAWTYGLPSAPACKHGPMPQKRGRSKAGKPYTGWFCPAGGPSWRGDRGDKCQAVFDD
jgi:hypothetical protein